MLSRFTEGRPPSVLVDRLAEYVEWALAQELARTRTTVSGKMGSFHVPDRKNKDIEAKIRVKNTVENRDSLHHIRQTNRLVYLVQKEETTND